MDSLRRHPRAELDSGGRVQRIERTLFTRWIASRHHFVEFDADLLGSLHGDTHVVEHHVRVVAPERRTTPGSLSEVRLQPEVEYVRDLPGMRPCD